MNRSLVWKEWRENRAMLAAGLAASFGIALLMSGFAIAEDTTYVLGAVTDMLPQLFLTLILPLFVALFGAATFSEEKTGKTLDFLISRPVSRTRVWSTKVGLAASSCLVLVFAAVALLWVMGASREGPNFLSNLLGSWPMAPGIGFLLFASTVLVSSRASQALAAAAMGALLALITFPVAPIVASSLGWWMRSGLNLLTGSEASAWRTYSEREVALHVAYAGAVYLLGSLWWFARKELREGIGARAAVGVVAAVVLAAFLSAQAPYALAQWTLVPDWGRVVSSQVSPDGTTILFEGRSADREQSQIWIAPAEGGRIERFSGRWQATFGPVFSSDGAQAAYFRSAHGPGSVHGVDLWIAGADGSGARRVAENAPRRARRWNPPAAQFSPDGTAVAILQDLELIVVSILDGETIRESPAELMGIDRRPGLVGWTSDGSEVVMRTRARDRYPYTNRFLAFDVETRTIRTVAGLERAAGIMVLGWLAGEGSSAADHVVLYWDAYWRSPTVGIRTIELLDARTGATQVLTEDACYSGSTMAGGALYYFSCHLQDGSGVTARLHRVDGLTLADEVVTELAGSVRGVAVDPSGEVFAVALHSASRDRSPLQIVTIDQQGAARETGYWSNFVPRGWTADGRILLGLRERSVSRLILLDPESGVGLPLSFY